MRRREQSAYPARATQSVLGNCQGASLACALHGVPSADSQKSLPLPVPKPTHRQLFAFQTTPASGISWLSDLYPKHGTHTTRLIVVPSQTWAGVGREKIIARVMVKSTQPTSDEHSLGEHCTSFMPTDVTFSEGD